jgi:hypothetical protein
MQSSQDISEVEPWVGENAPLTQQIEKGENGGVCRIVTVQNKKSISETSEGRPSQAQQNQFASSTESPDEEQDEELHEEQQEELLQEEHGELVTAPPVANLPSQRSGPNAVVRFQLIPISETPGKAAVGEVVERKLKEGELMKLGRQIIKDGQAIIKGNKKATELDVWFVSKVVSRLHAEIWTKDGQVNNILCSFV